MKPYSFRVESLYQESMLLISKFQDVVNLAEGIFHRVVAIDSKIVVAMEIIGTNRFGLCLIYLETFFDGEKHLQTKNDHDLNNDMDLRAILIGLVEEICMGLGLNIERFLQFQ